MRKSFFDAAVDFFVDWHMGHPTTKEYIDKESNSIRLRLRGADSGVAKSLTRGNTAVQSGRMLGQEKLKRLAKQAKPSI